MLQSGSGHGSPSSSMEATNVFTDWSAATGRRPFSSKLSMYAARKD